MGVLKAGLFGSSRRPAPVKMRLPDGTRASTPEESAGVFAVHFTQLYGRQPSGNAAVFGLLQQRNVTPGLDGEPSDEEIRITLRKLHDTGPGVSSLPAAAWKALWVRPTRASRWCATWRCTFGRRRRCRLSGRSAC